MVVITVSVCPPSLKGDISKWLFEVSPGVFAGNINQRVRENLWERICKTIGNGKAVMVFNARNEQAIDFKTIGIDWELKDFDGIQLMYHPNKPSSKERYKKKEYIVLDIETTGLDPQKDRIIEIGMLKVEDDKIVDQFEKFIAIHQEVPEFIVQLTKITASYLNENGEDELYVLQQAIQFIGNRPIVCHNIKFDLTFLQETAKRYQIVFPEVKRIDTLEIARKKMIGLPNYKLSTIAEKLNVKGSITHESIADCKITLAVLLKLNEIGKKEGSQPFI